MLRELAALGNVAISFIVSQILNIGHSNPASRGRKTYRNLWVNVPLYIYKTEKSKCSSVGGWTSKLHAMKQYSAIKRNELFIHTTHVNLKCVVLKERSDSECLYVYSLLKT
jgi:hypothetical protein